MECSFANPLPHLYPLTITLYNAGQISSIGVIAYLGAKHRLTSKSATFMLHRQPLRVPNLLLLPIGTRRQNPPSWMMRELRLLFGAMLNSLLNCAARLDSHDIYITGEEAVKFRVADAIGELALLQAHKYITSWHRRESIERRALRITLARCGWPQAPNGFHLTSALASCVSFCVSLSLRAVPSPLPYVPRAAKRLTESARLPNLKFRSRCDILVSGRLVEGTH